MSLFNILSSDGSRDPWASNNNANNQFSMFSSMQPSSQHNSQQQQQQQQNQQGQQQQLSQASQGLSQQHPIRRVSVSGSPSANMHLGSMALSSQSIDEDSPLGSFPQQQSSNTRTQSFDADTNFGLTSNNKSASTSSLTSSMSNPLILNGSNNSGVAGGAISNNSQGISNSNAGTGSSLPFMQSPFNIPGSSQQPQPYNDQRRFTWASSNLSIEPTANSSVVNNSAVTPTTNSTLNGGPFTFSPIISSMQKFREQLPVIPAQLQSHHTPIQNNGVLNHSSFLSNQPLLGLNPSSTTLENIGALFKRLDNTIFELKSEFNLLEQENEQLRTQLKQTQPSSTDTKTDSSVDFPASSSQGNNSKGLSGTV